jgi:hypothetical protein
MHPSDILRNTGRIAALKRAKKPYFYTGNGGEIQDELAEIRLTPTAGIKADSSNIKSSGR